MGVSAVTRVPAIDDLPCGIAVVGDDGLVMSANATLGDWLGRNHVTLPGLPLRQILTPSASLLYQTYVDPLLRLGQRAEEVSIALRHVSGDRIDTLMSAARMIDEAQGSVVCTFLRLQERRRLEYQLLTAKRAADEVPGLLFQLRRGADGGTHFTYVNEAMRRLFDVPPSQALLSADAVWHRLHPDDVHGVRRALDASAASQTPWRGEFRVLHADGVAWREVHATPQREPDGAVLWNGYIADITERRALEASLRDKAAAERASRAKTEFLARMSHELRTPLNGILGFARLLLMQEPANLRADQLTKLGHIELAGHGLLRLINEVLEISRIESGHTPVHLKAVPLEGLVRHALAMVEDQARQRQVRWRIDDVGDRHVVADEHRLIQVLMNLLSNAIKYGPDGGEVHVSVHEIHDRVCLGVRDQGPGLDAAQREQLFQPFNRLGAERRGIEGVGLGLAISQGLVRLMGGELCLVSGEGEGACFEVRLAGGRPGHAVPAPVAAGDNRPAGDAMALGELPIRVLYVEDNLVNALLMQSVFEGDDRFALEVVDTGERALQAVRRQSPHLMLLDVQLPDIDGVSLLARLRCDPGVRDVPAIAVSADAMPEDIQHARAAGFCDYWTKPLDVSAVVPEVLSRVQSARRAGSGGGGAQ